MRSLKAAVRIGLKRACTSQSDTAAAAADAWVVYTRTRARAAAQKTAVEA